MPRCRLVLALLAAALLAAGCGSDKKSGAAGVTPAGAIFYGQATLEPKGSQRRAVERLVAKFPGSGTPGRRIQGLIERALRDSDTGLSYRDDVKPWLGDEAAFFVSGPLREGRLENTALLLKSDDDEKARDAVEKLPGSAARESYRGHDFTRFEDGAAGTVSGFLVIGTEGGFKAAVDAAEDGKTLSDSDDFDNAVDDLPDDRLGFFYADPRSLLESAGLAAIALAPLKRAFGEPYTASVTADDTGLELAAKLRGSSASLLGAAVGEGSDLLGDLPADSWLAFGQPNLGKTLERYVGLFARSVGGRDALERQLRATTGLDLQRDVLDWMGDFGVFVRGESVRRLDGALLIETKDPAASRRALAAVARLLRRQDPAAVGRLTAPGGGEGFSVRGDELPQPLHVFQRGGRVVVAYGDSAARDALRPARTLSDSRDFRDAAASLGAGFSVSTYLAVRPLFALIEDESDDPDVRRARPYVDPFEALVAGAKRHGDTLESRLRVTVP